MSRREPYMLYLEDGWKALQTKTIADSMAGNTVIFGNPQTTLLHLPKGYWDSHLWLGKLYISLILQPCSSLWICHSLIQFSLFLFEIKADWPLRKRKGYLRVLAIDLFESQSYTEVILQSFTNLVSTVFTPVTFPLCPKHFYSAWPLYNTLIFIFGCWTFTTLYSFKAANLIMSLSSSHLSHFCHSADSKRRSRFHLNFVSFRTDDPGEYSGHTFPSTRIVWVRKFEWI